MLALRKERQVSCGIANVENDDRSNLTLDAQLCFAVYKNSNKVARLYRKYLQPFSLTFPLYLVMIVLWERAPCHVGLIVQALDLETSTVTLLLKRLQGLGYLSRTRDQLDERKVTIALTAQGHALRNEALNIRTDFIDRSGIPYEKATELRATLHNLSDIIDDLMKSRREPSRRS